VIAIVAPHDRPLHVGTAVALVLLLALTWRAQFEIGPGVASPAALAIVPMLFLLPLSAVPLLVPLGRVIAKIPDFVMKRHHVDRWLFCFADEWPTLGPVLVLGLLAYWSELPTREKSVEIWPRRKIRATITRMAMKAMISAYSTSPCPSCSPA
jgi:hypothetical protein